MTTPPKKKKWSIHLISSLAELAKERGDTGQTGKKKAAELLTHFKRPIANMPGSLKAPDWGKSVLCASSLPWVTAYSGLVQGNEICERPPLRQKHATFAWV